MEKSISNNNSRLPTNFINKFYRQVSIDEHFY